MNSQKNPVPRKNYISAALLLCVVLLSITFLPYRALYAQGGDIPVEDAARGLETKIRSQQQVGTQLRTVVEIPASQDAFVSSNQPDANFNANQELRVGYNQSGTNYGAVRSFAQFNLSAIPSGSSIISATLEFYQYSATPAGDAPMLVRLRHLEDAWDASTITWNNHQPDWGAVVAEAQIDTTTGWKVGDMTDIVREWYSGAHPNYGLFLQGDETPQERERIGYQVNANNGLHPRLVVTYGTNVDTIPPTSTVNALPVWSASTFTVTWQGRDNTGGSGIDYYDLQFNSNGGTWLEWRSGTEATTGTFTNGQHGVTYQFRSRAVDNAGNTQAWTNMQAQTVVDAIAPSATINPLPQWSGPNFTVSWGGTDQGSGIAKYDVQYNVNGGTFQNWQDDTTATSATFTGATGGATYQFRVSAEDKVGNDQPYGAAQAQTTIDTTPPSVSVNPLPPVSAGPTFYVSWTGSDNGSGIARYDVQSRVQGGAWTDWQIGTTATTAPFTGQDGVTYEFRARGTDNGGNIGQYPPNAQASTLVSSRPDAHMLQINPSVTQANSVVLHWEGTTAPGTTIVAYDIRYRRDRGNWQHFLTTEAVSATFNFPDGPDAFYEFEVRATNNLGQTEPYNSVGEAYVFLDRVAPFIVPQAYMPLVFNNAP